MARKKTTAKRWPPNVGVNNGNVRYRRQIPKDFVSVAGLTVYSEHLTSLTPESSFEEACEASKPVTARYDVLVKSLRNSSIDATEAILFFKLASNVSDSYLLLSDQCDSPPGFLGT